MTQTKPDAQVPAYGARPFDKLRARPADRPQVDTRPELADGRTRPGSTRTGLLIALGSAASFALSGSLGTALLSIGWSPTAAVGVRVGGAFLVLLVPCLILLRRTGLPTRRQLGRLVAYGAIAVAGAQLCYFSAMQYLSVGVALLLEYTAPVILIGYHWARSRRRPATLVFVGAAAAIAGLVLVLDPGHDAVISPIGVAWGLAAALCACGYFLLSESDGSAAHRDAAHKTAPKGPEAPVPPLLLVTAGTGIGGLLILALGLTGLMPLRATTGDASLGGLDVPWWLPMLGLILVTAALAYLLGIAGIRRLGSGVASFVALTEVIFAVGFAVVLLGQQPSVGQLIGGVLVLAGIAAVQRGDRR
jgi:drug/metabolite transporter (DMT)-like permease